MHITISSSNPSKTKLDALVIATVAFERSAPPWGKLGADLARLCADADPLRQFCGKEGSVLVVPTLGQITPKLLALAGMGKSTDVAAQRRCLGKAIRQLRARKVRSLGLFFTTKPSSFEWTILTAEESFYNFCDFSEARDENPTDLSRLVLFSSHPSAAKLTQAKQLARSIRYARSLANQPPNLFYPSVLAAEAQKLARHRGLRCGVWDQRRLKRDGFGGILAVGQGSHNPPRFIRLDYSGGRRHQPPFVVVGKAVTFDTGGISIKPSDKMDEMKFDKCGGMAVLGIMDAVAAMRLPLNITGLIASAENMPSANAYRPGDLIRTLSGKYVEVLNTDAEGRIILADALTYAQRLKPRAIVDLATLTGACIVCFGHECAAVLGNQNSLLEELRAAAERTGEKIWPLPLWPEYQEKVKSDIAFVKNTAGREGGTITGACFLNAFVETNVSWPHLAIAGMAWSSKEEPHRAKGATAFGVNLVTDWLRSLV